MAGLPTVPHLVVVKFRVLSLWVPFLLSVVPLAFLAPPPQLCAVGAEELARV